MHGHMNVKSKDMFEQNLTAHSYNLNWKKKLNIKSVCLITRIWLTQSLFRNKNNTLDCSITPIGNVISHSDSTIGLEKINNDFRHDFNILR